jgi:hypothetical protein
MSAVMVRYQVRPDRVEDNLALVRAVYAELAATPRDGFRYSTYRLEDGVTFVHVAVYDGDFPLGDSTVFRAFADSLPDRCDRPPERTVMDVVGAYAATPS